MAILAAKSSLNPEAPEFKPNKNSSFYYPPTPPFFNQYLQAPPSIYSTLDPSFFYPVRSTPPSPYTQYPPYTNPYPTQLIPQYHDLMLLSKPEPPVTEPAPPLAVSEKPHVVREPKVEPEVVAQNGYKRGVKRGYRNVYFQKRNGGGGGREGFQGRQCYGNRQAWRGKVGIRNMGGFSRYQRKGQSWQKHEVVPVQPGGHCTTVMIKNLPSRYTRDLLLEFLDDHCMVENQKAQAQNSDAFKEPIVSAFDFLYLPMDFNSGMNKGYAFVNFTDPRSVWKFRLATDNQAWSLFQSNKRCEIACARLQGKEKLVKHFANMLFPCEEYLPVCFSPARDGSRELVKQIMVGILKGDWDHI